MLLFTTPCLDGIAAGGGLLVSLLALYGVFRLAKIGVAVMRQVVLVTRQGLLQLQSPNPQTQRTGIMQLVPAGIITSMLLTVLGMIGQSMPGSQGAGLAQQKRVDTSTRFVMKADNHRLVPHQQGRSLTALPTLATKK